MENEVKADLAREEVVKVVGAILRDPASAEFFIEKAGKTMRVRNMGKGAIMGKCKSACCKEQSRWQRFDLLPCKHHAMLRVCTCPLRDRQCRGCRKVYVGMNGQWYEVDDPHGKKEV